MTVVGHGLWELVAWLIRMVVTGSVSAAEPLRQCPRCQAVLGLRGFCHECHWPAERPASDLVADVQAALRQIERLRKLGAISDDTYARVKLALQPTSVDVASAVDAGEASVPPVLSEPTPHAVGPAESEPPCARPVPPLPIVEIPGPADRPSVPVKPRRQLLALGKPYEPPPPPPPSKPLSEVLAAFMEEKNIRWGELVGGLLIIGCSIALVVSLWSQIAQTPALKFYVFTAVTASLYGIGLYTEHRWKLPTTSRGVLIIATLLVPLNFLAIAKFSKGSSLADPLVIGGEVLALGLFSYLIYAAGRVLTPAWPWVLAIGVVAPSAAELVIRRLAGPGLSVPMLLGLGGLPLLLYGGTTGWMIDRARRWTALRDKEANTIFITLGVATFAALLPLGLLLVETRQVATALRDIAPLVSLFGLPALAAGLVLWRRLTEPDQATLRTSGTAVAVAGAMVMLSGIVLAWPNPAGMLPTVALDFAALSIVAVAFEMPAAHLLATACLMLAYLVGLHLATGEIAWTGNHSATVAAALVSARSGTALAALVAMFAASSQWLRRLGRAHDGFFYVVATGATGLVSLALVSWFGFGRAADHGATWVFAAYAAASFWLAGQLRREAVTWCGSALLLAALGQGLAYRFAETLHLAHPWSVALLLHASLASIAAAALQYAAERLAKRPQAGAEPASGHGTLSAAEDMLLPGTQYSVQSTPHSAFRAPHSVGTPSPADSATVQRLFIDPLGWSSLATSLASLPFLFAAVPSAPAATLAVRVGWLAAVWFACAWQRRMAGAFTAAQFAGSVAVFLTVRSVVAQQPWFAASRWGLWDVRSVQAEGVALAIFCLGWVLLRLMLRRRGVQPVAAVPRDPIEPGIDAPPRDVATWLLYPSWPAYDRMLASGLLVVLTVLVVSAVLPGVAAELATSSPPDQPIRPLASDTATLARGPGSWLLCASLLAVFVASLWERFTRWFVAGAVVAATAACPLAAGCFEPQQSSASAMRWLAAGLLALGSVPFWFRGALATQIARLGWPGWDDRSRGVAAEARALLLALTITPVLAITLYASSVALAGDSIVGPAAGSFFARIGNAVSYSAPLLVVSLALVGHAVRDRSATFAFNGGLVLNLTVSLAYLLSVVTAGGSVGVVEFVRLIQFNAITFAAFALAWMAGRSELLRRTAGVGRLVDQEADVSRSPAWPWQARAAAGPAPFLLQLQIVLGLAANVLVIAPATATIFLRPDNPGRMVAEVGNVAGWIGLGLACLAARGIMSRPAARPSVELTCIGMLTVSSMVACVAARWDTALLWWGYHTLLAGWTATGWALLAACWRLEPHAARESESVNEDRASAVSSLQSAISDLQSAWRRTVAAWVILIVAATVATALRGLAGDPNRPWWTVGAITSAGVLAAVLARWTLRGGLLYVAGVLLNLATSVWWVMEWGRTSQSPVFEFIEVNIIALALPSLAWLAMELRVLSRSSAGGKWRWRPFHRVAGGAAVAAMLFDVVLRIGVAALAPAGRPMNPPLLGWAALFSVAALLVGCVWDVAARSSAVGLYVLGLCGVGLVLDGLNLAGDWLGWSGLMVLAAYSVATSFAFSRRDVLAGWSARLGVPSREASPSGGAAWLVPANFSLATVVIVLAYWVDLTFDELPLRLSAAKAAVAQALAVGLLAHGDRRWRLQHTSLWIGVVGAVAWGWAWLDPGTTGNVLNRAVVVMTVLAAMIVLYGVGLAKLFPRETDWTVAARRAVPALVCLTGLSLVFVLGAEVVEYGPDGAAMAWPAIVAVAAALGGLAVAALVCAVVPGRDPLELPERGRMRYVYAAESLVALLCLHIGLTMPWLFRGFFEQYWPFVVMALAFLGAGLSELFRRQGRLVLAEPLERTGAFLPLLPVVGFWVLSPQVHYSGLLLLVGVLYGVLSISRRSFGFGVLAAIAGNGGLWYYLQHDLDGFGLLEHPQVWLIPPALSVLAAAYLNRDRLSESQMASVRYICLMTVYVSSTADIFINGVAHNPWLPVVLAGLSVLGILAGILIRVRSFLFLGSSFLVLAIFTMIWHAAVDLDHTWLWYLSGIVLGAAIIAVFAVFEKKRGEVLRVVEGLKQWQR